MSGESDRIAVPTNGRGPHPVAPLPPTTESEPAPEPTIRPARDLSVAVSPERLAVGLGIVVSLVLLVVGLARRGRPRD